MTIQEVIAEANTDTSHYGYRWEVRKWLAQRMRPALERWGIHDVETASYECAREIMGDFKP